MNTLMSDVNRSLHSLTSSAIMAFYSSRPSKLLPYRKPVAFVVGMASCLVGIGAFSSPARGAAIQGYTTRFERIAQAIPNPVIDVGIAQRFGDEATDELILEAQDGDRLTVKFANGNQEQEVSAPAVKLNVTMQELPQPQVVERIVLSTHRSFESAEDSANFWRSQGIEVEVAQPRMWQVWAKRDVYHSPLLRRLLLHNVQANGARTAFVDTRTRRAQPKVAFEVNGFRYQRDRFEISSRTRRIRVTGEGQDGTRIYGGEMRFQPNTYGTYTLVNEVPIETYLRGVVPHEIGLGAPRPAIEAQAVLARTYALRNLRRFAIDDYELCADTQCQVYWGLGGAAEVSDRAIAATRGNVLTYQNELIDALYSSTTGGITAPFSHVWNGPDRNYLRAVVDSVSPLWDLTQRPLSNEQHFRSFMSLSSGFNEEEWDTFRWRREGTLESLAEDMRKYLNVTQHPLANFNTVEKLEVTERADSGRVQKLAVTTDLGVVELEKDEVVRALYPPRSTLFYLDPIFEEVPPSEPTPSPDAPALDNTLSGSTPEPTSPIEEPAPPPARILKGYAFVGGGFGHGVGMSQTGAYNLGELGWTSDRILSFYYPGSELTVLNDDIVFWREPGTAEPVSSDEETVSSETAVTLSGLTDSDEAHLN